MFFYYACLQPKTFRLLLLASLLVRSSEVHNLTPCFFCKICQRQMPSPNGVFWCLCLECECNHRPYGVSLPASRVPRVTRGTVSQHCRLWASVKPEWQLGTRYLRQCVIPEVDSLTHYPVSKKCPFAAHLLCVCVGWVGGRIPSVHARCAVHADCMQACRYLTCCAHRATNDIRRRCLPSQACVPLVHREQE